MSERGTRTIAVTGSASGLGAAVCRREEAAGARVVTVDVHDADIVADLSTDAGRTAAITGIRDASGGALDGLVVCAGLGPHIEDHGLIVGVNYFGAITLLDGLLPALSAARPAAAVAISSNSTTLDPTVDAALVQACLDRDEPAARSRAAALTGNSVYASSKLGVARAVRRRVQAWGDAGVRINAVAPGPFESALLAASRADPQLGPMIDALPVPTGHIPEPDEIASAIGFLLSRDASYVHGSILFVDGGIDALVRPDAL